jgi:site-specific recombinase XerD
MGRKSASESFTFESLVKSFLSSKAKGSIPVYSGTIAKWEAFLAERSKSPFDATEMDAMQFIENYGLRIGQKNYHSKETGMVSKFTLKHRSIILKSFYEFLLRLGRVQGNPFFFTVSQFARIQSGQTRPTQTVPFERVRELLDCPSETSSEGIRDRALLALWLGVGMRLGETLNLTEQDFQHDESGAPFLVLRNTKSQKVQRQALPGWVASRVATLIQKLNSEAPGGFKGLFVTYVWDENTLLRVPSGRLLRAPEARKLFKRYCALRGLPTSLSPHSCRATVATKLLADGWDYRSVQEVLRHSSIQMVEKYDKRRFEISNSPARKIEWD